MSVEGMKNTGPVIAGVGNLYIADLGTDWPTVDGEPESAVAGETLALPAGWTKMTTYTDGGYRFFFKENNTPISVDQQRQPILYIPNNAESYVELALASMDHTLMTKLVSGASTSQSVAGVGVAGQKNIWLGGSSIKEFQILIEGLSPDNPAGSAWYELIFIWKAIPTSELQKNYKKLEKQMIQGRWDVTADLTRTAGREMARIVAMSSLGSS